jgi:hypothetical protein
MATTTLIFFSQMSRSSPNSKQHCHPWHLGLFFPRARSAGSITRHINYLTLAVQAKVSSSQAPTQPRTTYYCIIGRSNSQAAKPSLTPELKIFITPEENSKHVSALAHHSSAGNKLPL